MHWIPTERGAPSILRVMNGIVVALVATPVSAVLLCSGMAKLAVPQHAARAVSELVPMLGRYSVALIRTLAAVEAVTAIAVLTPSTRPVGVAAVGGLGATFFATGVAGLARRAAAPCGCLGRGTGQPAGRWTVAAGVTFVAAAVALAGRTHMAGGHVLAVAAAGLTVVLAGWVYRDLIRDLVRPQNPPTEPMGSA
jgi:hypothetical protein